MQVQYLNTKGIGGEWAIFVSVNAERILSLVS